MTDKKHDVPIAGHEYDGISELDNQLPRWWVWLFYLTIAFSAVYFAYYVLGPGPTLLEKFESRKAAIELAKLAPGAKKGFDEQELLAVFKDTGQREKGKVVYAVRCLACHGPMGQGSIGPNLTDNHWIHGKGTMADVAQTVSAGVLDKGMPAWESVLSPDELKQVVAYVRSLKGTNPPGAKAPQGTEYKN
jgi:cytochrome c oxidase cbb3-type subunit 3